MLKSCKRLALATCLTSALAGCGGADDAPVADSRQAAAPTAADSDAAAPAAAPAAGVRPAAAPEAAPPQVQLGYMETSQAATAQDGPAGAPGLRSYRAVNLILELPQDGLSNPALELSASGRRLGRIALQAQTAAAGDAGPRYTAHHWRADIPAGWAVPGLSLRVHAERHRASESYVLPLRD